MITPRAKLLFLVILFMALTVVLAIFGLVIAIIFALYPESVLSVWIEIPLAVGIGLWIYRRGGNILIPSIIALGIMYIGMGVGRVPASDRLFGVVWHPATGTDICECGCHLDVDSVCVLFYCVCAAGLDTAPAP